MIPARGKALVDTDISMAVPAGTCMFVLFLSLPPFLCSTSVSVFAIECSS